MRFGVVLLMLAVSAGCLADNPTPTSPGLTRSDDPSQDARQNPLPDVRVPPRNPPPVERGSVPPARPAPPASASCDHTKAQGAIGRDASDRLLERARLAAGARTARFLRPNQPVTTEYLGSRLNLGLDEHDVVRWVVCG